MKKSFLIVIIGMLSFGMTMNSCTKDDETDSRDQYVGAWVMVSEGTVDTLFNGDIEETEIVNETETVNISKSGENDLLIDGRIFSVNGFNLTSTPYANPFDEGKYTGSIIFTTVGVLSSDTITLQSDVTGTWSYEEDGTDGTFNGNVVHTLSKP
jgi:hypothetical protein